MAAMWVGMSKTRLEAFSDGVIAILITIMVLELHSPEGADLAAADRALCRTLRLYLLSFVILGIYWNNHHHLLHADARMSTAGPVGEPAPALLAVAGSVRDPLDGRERISRRCRPRSTASCCCCAAIAYTILAARSSPLSRRTRCSRRRSAATSKASVSLVLYAPRFRWRSCIRWIAVAIFVLVALIWLVPDRRIEARINTPPRSSARGE